MEAEIITPEVEAAPAAKSLPLRVRGNRATPSGRRPVRMAVVDEQHKVVAIIVREPDGSWNGRGGSSESRMQTRAKLADLLSAIGVRGTVSLQGHAESGIPPRLAARQTPS